MEEVYLESQIFISGGGRGKETPDHLGSLFMRGLNLNFYVAFLLAWPAERSNRKQAGFSPTEWDNPS
jgi:hypothetical protein